MCGLNQARELDPPLWLQSRNPRGIPERPTHNVSKTVFFASKLNFYFYFFLN